MSGSDAGAPPVCRHMSSRRASGRRVQPVRWSTVFSEAACRLSPSSQSDGSTCGSPPPRSNRLATRRRLRFCMPNAYAHPVFTKDVRELLRGAGVHPVRLPPRSPNLKAYAERFVLSINSECLNKLIILGEAHLRLAVREYVAHYNGERPHQGIGGEFVTPPANENRAGPIECNERLGGLLRYYRRQAL